MKKAIILAILMTALLCGCKSEEVIEDTKLGITVTKSVWHPSGSGNIWVENIEKPEVGNIIIDSDDTGMVLKATIDEVTDKYIVLDIDSEVFVPRNEDGSINLNAKTPEEIKIASGESVDLCSQTMDYGHIYTIEYNYNGE